MLFSRKIIKTICFVITFSCLGAQDYSRIAPKPMERELGSVNESKTDGGIGDSGEAFLKEFKGLVLLEDETLFLPSGRQGITGLETKIALRNRDVLERTLGSFFGKPLSVKGMGELQKKIESHFRNQESIWVRAIIPEQKVKDEVLQIEVIRSSVGKVSVEGNRWFAAEDIRKEFQMNPGDPVQDQKMGEALDWVNRNPFRQADLCLAPGSSGGETDLILKVRDRFPVRFYAGYEDSGNALTGKDRYLTGFNWGDAFFQGHQMNYQFTTSNPMSRFEAHSGSYVIPLPWHHELDFFGVYSEAEGRSADLGIAGKSWQVSTRYRISLPTLREVRQEVALGYDFKQSNNNLEFGGQNVFTHLTDVSQFVGEYNGNLRDGWGSTHWGSKVFLSPGGMSENDRNTIYNESRAFAKSDYSYGQVEFERKFRLPWGITTRHSAIYQWSSGNLLGSEQLGLGGRDSVPGYEEREVNGDEGYLFQNEIWSPVGSAADLLTDGGVSGLKRVKDRLQGLIFWNYGAVRDRVLLPSSDREQILSSVGLGIRYTLNTYVSFRADYGVQLTDSGQQNRESSRVHMSLTVSY